MAGSAEDGATTFNVFPMLAEIVTLEIDGVEMILVNKFVTDLASEIEELDLITIQDLQHIVESLLISFEGQISIGGNRVSIHSYHHQALEKEAIDWCIYKYYK